MRRAMDLGTHGVFAWSAEGKSDMAVSRRNEEKPTSNEQEHQPLIWRIKALAEALEGSTVAVLDVTEGNTRVVVKRRLATEYTMVPPMMTEQPRASRRMGTMRRVQANGMAHGGAAVAPAPDPTVAVVAPLTGVFYASSSPSTPPFAQVGETIQAGQVVCIVEAMKVFNEIKAEVSGMITAVLAKDGQLVQKGDALIRVKSV